MSALDKPAVFWSESYFLFFSVPPDIDDRQTSSDVIVNEGDDADLVCKANGHPRPTIEWFREDKTHINVMDLKFNHSRRLTGVSLILKLYH